MNQTELKVVMKEALEESQELKQRIIDIMQMDLVPGTHLYGMWMEEAMMLRMQWMTALGRYMDAGRDFARQRLKSME